jgi:regulator of replication initiation timing
MSVLSDARQALVELPVSDILRERLNLAFDRTAELEQQVMTLQSKVTALEAENLELRTEIQAVTLDRDNARHELQTQRKLASATKHENPLAASNPRVTGHGLTSKRII